MTDIFLSYSRDDQATARRFADAFEREGLTVWWDQTLNPGEAFDEVTERALNEARAVVVLWSKKSVASRWVRAEATQANDNKTLVPVMIEPCKRPIMFELTHTADLSHWKGNPDDPGWQSYLAGVKRIVRKDMAGALSPAGVRPVAIRPRKTGLGVLVGIAAVLLIAVAAFWAMSRKSGQPSTTQAPSTSAVPAAPAPARAAGKPRIAIMPFENLSPEPGNAFFADGLHEELLTTLANSAPGLEVVSRTTMMTYREHRATVAQLAHDLGVTHVVEGTVRREGDDVRLTLQLIDARTDGHLWAQNYDRKLAHAMSLESEVARQIAVQLSMKLEGGSAGAVPPTSDPGAYDLYLKARLLAQSVGRATTSSWGAREAVLVYTQAITRDPKFALAYVGRALARFVVTTMPLGPARSDLDSARRLGGDPAYVEAAEGLYKFWAEHDSTAALAAFGKAQAAGLSDPLVQGQIADALLRLGKQEDAVALYRHLLSLDPASTERMFDLAIVLWGGRSPKEAITLMNAMTASSVALVGHRIPGEGGGTADCYFYFTGDAGPRWAAYAGETRDLTEAAEQEAAFATYLGERVTGDPSFPARYDIDFMRFEHRYAEILGLLDSFPNGLLPMGIFNFFEVTGLEQRPAAEFRGWTNLLLGNSKAAEEDGRATLYFVAHTKQTPRNDWILSLIKSEGLLFTGDRAGAVAAAQGGLKLMPRSRDAVESLYASYLAAEVLAWAGSKDEAAMLLEVISSSVPGIGPATVVRDPALSVPLAANARYVRLKSELEEQMATWKRQLPTVSLPK